MCVQARLGCYRSVARMISWILDTPCTVTNMLHTSTATRLEDS